MNINGIIGTIEQDKSYKKIIRNQKILENSSDVDLSTLLTKYTMTSSLRYFKE